MHQIISTLIIFSLIFSSLATAQVNPDKYGARPERDEPKKEAEYSWFGTFAGIATLGAAGAAIHKFWNSIAPQKARRDLPPRKKPSSSSSKGQGPKAGSKNQPTVFIISNSNEQLLPVNADLLEQILRSIQPQPSAQALLGNPIVPGTSFLGEGQRQTVVRDQGTTTAPFRFPHLDLHLMGLPSAQGQRTIYIFGPGVARDGSIPQLHELMPFFSQDRIIVVDISSDVIKAVEKSRYENSRKVAKSALSISDNWKTNQKTERNNLSSHLDQVPDTLGTNIETIQSDFATLDLQPNSADVIIATFSLLYAFNGLEDQEASQLVRRVLSAIRPGGTFYTDLHTARVFSRLATNELRFFEWTVIPCITQSQIRGTHVVYLNDPSISTAERVWASTSNIVALKKKQ